MLSLWLPLPLVLLLAALCILLWSHRLDIELGRLEFEVHPYMALEQQLVSGGSCIQ